MRIDGIVRNLRALARANSIIAEIHARHLLARTSLTGFAAMIAGFGLLMLGLSGYFALESIWGPIWAAAAIGLFNCLVALALIVIASFLRPARELELARDIHRSALEGLIVDGRALEVEFANFKQAFRNPVDSALPRLIVPLTSVLIKMLQKRSEKPGK